MCRWAYETSENMKAKKNKTEIKRKQKEKKEGEESRGNVSTPYSSRPIVDTRRTYKDRSGASLTNCHSS